MKILVALTSILAFCFISLHAQTIEGTCFELKESSPWSQSILLSDSAVTKLELKKISGVKIKLIQDWNRFADDYHGPNYKEWDIPVDAKGRFKINLDVVDKSKLLVIEAFKEGYLFLRYTFRAGKLDFGNKVKLILVPQFRKK